MTDTEIFPRKSIKKLLDHLPVKAQIKNFKYFFFLTSTREIKFRCVNLHFEQYLEENLGRYLQTPKN